MSGAAAPDVAASDTLQGALGAKLLGDWLRNRQQLLVPLTLDLSQVDAASADLLLRAMAAAAQACGQPDDADHTRLTAALERMKAKPEQQAGLHDRLSAPEPMNAWLAQVEDAPTATLVYAAALLAVDQRATAGTAWLRYLAARLGLARELVKNLEQRYRVAL